MLESKMQLLYYHMVPYQLSLFYFSFQNNSLCFILRIFLSLEIWRTKIFSTFLAQYPKSLYSKCSHLSCINLLGSKHWLWPAYILSMSIQNQRFFLFFSLLILLLMLFVGLFNKLYLQIHSLGIILPILNLLLRHQGSHLLYGPSMKEEIARIYPRTEHHGEINIWKMDLASVFGSWGTSAWAKHEVQETLYSQSLF